MISMFFFPFDHAGPLKTAFDHPPHSEAAAAAAEASDSDGNENKSEERFLPGCCALPLFASFFFAEVFALILDSIGSCVKSSIVSTLSKHLIHVVIK